MPTMFPEWRPKERELEDWLMKHPGSMWPNAALLGRQVCLPHGRLDLLAWMPPHGIYCGSLVIVELKAKQIREGDIGQALRYAYDVKEVMVEHVAFDEVPFGDAWDAVWAVTQGAPNDGIIRAMVIGPSIRKDALALANATNVEVMLYTPNPVDHSFVLDRVLDYDRRRIDSSFAQAPWAKRAYALLRHEGLRLFAKRMAR